MTNILYLSIISARVSTAMARQISAVLEWIHTVDLFAYPKKIIVSATDSWTTEKKFVQFQWMLLSPMSFYVSWLRLFSQ